MKTFIAATTAIAISTMMATSAFALDLSAGAKASTSVKAEKSASASASGEASGRATLGAGVVGAAGSTLNAIGDAGSAVVDGAVGVVTSAYDATATAAVEASNELHGVSEEAIFNARAAFETGARTVWSEDGTVLGTIHEVRMNADGSESVTIALDGTLGLRAETVTISASAFAEAEGGAVVNKTDAEFVAAVEQAAEAQAQAQGY
jgi:hypothetical protein